MIATRAPCLTTYRAGFIDFRGVRDPATSRRLAAALRRDQGAAVESLRRDEIRRRLYTLCTMAKERQTVEICLVPVQPSKSRHLKKSATMTGDYW